MKIFLTLTFIFLTTILYTQTNFKIIASRGEVVVQNINYNNFKKVKTGYELVESDKVILNDNSYVGLVTKSGKTLELKQSGIYNVSDLLKGINNADNSNMVERYIGYVFESLRAGTDEHVQNMSITGSVERSLEDHTYNLFLPSETRLIQMDSFIHWDLKDSSSSSSEETYLKIFNLFDEELISIKSNNMSVYIDFNDSLLVPGETYKLQVLSEKGDKKSNVVTLRFPGEEELNDLLPIINELNNSLDSNSALSNMIFATFLENNGLYLNALNYYQKSINLQPEVEVYQETYDDFLIKMGLK